ncbi:MlaD family protein [Shewanella sp. Isolate11]|uniref:MlaD family protein n=1 Tax=Shewanella sp. Isolate11 TaxID=2908530 RepID=UPI001EFE4F43|nr:MlaD family protein [Shewanella sp. Isolate11]MCG9696489.1 MlaD family protein [Shewanella sp. Isolate11]
MTEIETPKVVKKKLFSPIWLLPIVALVLGAWLGIKSIRESGIEVRIHFPSATGIDVGKTLVRYQGLTVGKVVDISIDETLQGVNVDLLMDYRSTPFLRDETKFWLVTPKASITGVEGLDALFSGNYIAIQPGDGESRKEFVAEDQAPPVAPGSDGLMIELTSANLGSLDVGSQVFYRQIPVGKIVSYRLVDNETILLNAYIQKQYAYLVKQNSSFWNVSGLSLDASLSGVKIKTESLAAILAGGVTFTSDPNAKNAEPNQKFPLHENEESATTGHQFGLIADNADSIQTGSSIVFRGIEIGHISQTHLLDNGVKFEAILDNQYADLLSGSAQFWREGADISLDGIKHAKRMVTGDVINFMPGIGDAKDEYRLLDSAPDMNAKPLLLKLSADENPGITTGAEVRYKQLPIGRVNQVNFKSDYSGIEYHIEIWAEFKPLLTQTSYFIPEAALAIDASLDGVSVKTRDLNTLTKGAISLFQGTGTQAVTENSTLSLYTSTTQADERLARRNMQHITLSSPDGADLSANSPVYFKKMQIGKVIGVNWQSATEDFAITLGIENTFASLIKPNSVFWRNDALAIDASLSGVKVNIAPLAGAIKGSVTLGLLDDTKQGDQQHLYGSKTLALTKAVPVQLSFPASSKLAAHAPIRYLGHQVGEIDNVSLDSNLKTISANAYLYGDYAALFSREDSRYFLVDAQISLSGISAAETLLTGPYVSVIPGVSQQTTSHFVGVEQAPVQLAEDAQSFTLVDNDLGSIKVGTPIIFRGIKIGEIKHYQLAENGTQVLMQAEVAADYRHLVNQTSQFWDLSGIKVDVGLFSGAQIETGSLESILAGGIGVATEKVSNAQNQIQANTQFMLQSKSQDEWLKWAPNQPVND